MDLEAYVDVVPWLLFVVIDRRSGLGLSWAAVSAMGCGAAIAAWSHWRLRPTPIGWVAVGTFGSLMVIAYVVDGNNAWFEPTLRAAAVLMLAVVGLVSLRGRPLSEIYTADRVPLHRHSDPGFSRVNRRITALWALTALLVAASFSAVALVPTPVGLTVFDWVLPIAIMGTGLRSVAHQWSLYLASSEGDEASALSESSFRDLAERGTPAGHERVVITYLRGAHPGR